MPKKDSFMRIDKKLLEELRELKEFERETYADVIRRKLMEKRKR
jgi:predicted CopG family antitoxin